MKKLFFLVIILAALYSESVAQSMLKVRTADNQRINVMLDGRYFNKTGTSVTVGDLPKGRHRLRIYTMAQTRGGREYQAVIYEGKIRTDFGAITLFVFDPNTGQVDMQQQEINSYLNEHPIPNANTEPNNEISNSDENNNDISSSQVASPAASEATSSLTTAKIDELKTKVAAKKTDTEKMNTLKDGLKNESVTTGQVSEMMDWFSFESAKVEFAEWAYTYTVDKDYFTELESKFTYKNYQDELDKFIRDKK